MDTISGVARGLNVKAPATIVVGEVASVLHGPAQGLLSDSAEGLFAGVDKDKVASAAKRVAERTERLRVNGTWEAEAAGGSESVVAVGGKDAAAGAAAGDAAAGAPLA